MKMKCLTLALLAIVGMGSAHASVIEIGDGASSPHDGDIAIGDGAECQNLDFPNGAGFGKCTVLGRNAYNYYGGTSIGDGATSRRGGTAIGNSTVAGEQGFAGGYQSNAGDFAVAILGQAVSGSVAIQGTTTAWNAVAINGTADMSGSATIMGHTRGRANVIAFGDEQTGVYRQLTGVAAGTAGTDAANVAQLSQVAASFGGGANITNGVYTGPTYNLSTGTYNNVGDALTALDNKPGGGGTPNPYFKSDGVGGGVDDAQVTAGTYGTVAGSGSSVTKYGGTGVGSQVLVDGEAGTGVGHQSQITSDEGTGVGAYTKVDARCDAIGYASECSEDDTTSFGRDGDNSRLTHVADGQDDTDAANMGQVRAVDSRVTQTQSVVSSQASWFGGGANYDPVTGVFNGPSYAFISGATYSNVGDALADLDQRVYDLEQQPPGSGPAGPQGADGRSAYEVAVDNGFPGTEQEWLASLKGDQGERGERGERGEQGERGETGSGEPGEPGSDGQDGRSAYEIAVEDGGFVGTEQEWLESLQGADGQDGAPGRDGVGGSKVKGGSNIAVTENDDGTQTVALSDNVKLSDQGSVEVGATRVDGNGVTIQGGPSMTTNGVDAGRKRVTNVAPGRIASDSWDAVNGSQLWEMNDRWEHRIDGLDKRISGVCAMGAAQSQAVAASANNRATHKWMAGVGFCGGQAAMHAGYSQDFTTPRGSIMSFSAGISSTGDDTSIGFGLSGGW